MLYLLDCLDVPTTGTDTGTNKKGKAGGRGEWTEIFRTSIVEFSDIS